MAPYMLTPRRWSLKPHHSQGLLPIAFLVQQSDGSWSQVGSATTDVNGVAQLQLPIASGTTSYDAEFAGDGTYDAVQSASVQVVGVQATTVMSLYAPATDSDGSTIKVTGTWNYNDPRIAAAGVADARVAVYVRSAGSTTWRLYTTLTTSSAGQFSWYPSPFSSTYFKAVGDEEPGALTSDSTVYVREVPASTVYRPPAGSPRPSGLRVQPHWSGAGANAVVTTIPNSVWDTMVGVSWHRGCPLSRSAMRLITINYYGFDGYRHRGRLIVSYRGVHDFVGAFTALYRAKIPLHGLYLVDRFGYSSATGGADDYASMEHDNTSAYDCRWVDGNPGVLSPHSFGLAVDINPFENPYDSRLGWTPNWWWSAHKVNPYTWRSYGDEVVAIMEAHGFRWTYGRADSQHFDAVRGLT